MQDQFARHPERARELAQRVSQGSSLGLQARSLANTLGMTAPAVFALLTFAMFFDVLFTRHRVLSAQGTDLFLQFIPWREFGFLELRHGNLALWNPHIYGGAPYLAGFQSALLYPPNWLHLILPVTVAINWIVALHVFFAGYFTYLWCRGRAIGIGGSILAGVMFMFCGPYFLHLYAGHLPHLAVMVWTPLMLLAIDKLAATGNWRWSFLGVVATSLQILAGHPQYVYYTGIAISVYVIILAISSTHRLELLGGFAGMYVGAILVTAIQLLPAIAGAGEMVRSGGLKYEMAATFSLPFENLITLLVPSFFGNVPLHETDTGGYWAAGYLWELSLFVSLSGLILAVIGIIRAQRRAVMIVAAMIVITMILALGRHTPLYWPMFKYLPQYSSFRGTVKFAYLVALFVCVLAGMGLDALLRERRVPFALLASVVAVAILFALAGAIFPSSESWPIFVGRIVQQAKNAGEMFLGTQPDDPAFIMSSAAHAATMCFVTAGILVLVTAALWAARLHELAPYSLLLIATVEMFTFARCTRATMDPTVVALPTAWRDAIQHKPNDQRVLTTPVEFANIGMSLGFDNVSGYDPGIFKRYAELIYASQDMDPSEATQYLWFRKPCISVFRMLRCGLICVDPSAAPMPVPSPLPTAVLVSDWVQLKGRNTILAYLVRDSFDASQTVVLESPPDVKTVSSASPPGSVRVVAQTSDSLELSAELQRPAILVVTDNYSSGWRIVPVEPSPLSVYQIMPANYTQVGVPLQPGKHHFILEYSPTSFRVGRWISVVSILALSAASVLLMRGSRRFR